MDDILAFGLVMVALSAIVGLLSQLLDPEHEACKGVRE